MSSDGTIVVTPDVAVQDQHPAPVEISTRPRELTQAQLRDYAQATGKKLVKIKDIGRTAILGELIERLGAARRGAAILVESEDDIAQGIELAKQTLERHQGDPIGAASALRVLLGFVDLKVKTAHTLIRSKKDSSENSETKPLTTPFPPAAPLQVNIQNNLVGQDSSGE